MSEYRYPRPAPGYPYKVQNGDTLQAIARQAYGDDSQAAWEAIYNANKSLIGGNPNWLRFGLVLTIPVTPYEYPASPTPQPGYTYTVRRGDSLQSIARRAYGDGSQQAQQAIYSANRNLVGPDSHRLPPGNVLRIPPFDK